jgi:diguanylate cyclase (GGDEF)-like protein
VTISRRFALSGAALVVALLLLGTGMWWLVGTTQRGDAHRSVRAVLDGERARVVRELDRVTADLTPDPVGRVLRDRLPDAAGGDPVAVRALGRELARLVGYVPELRVVTVLDARGRPLVGADATGRIDDPAAPPAADLDAMTASFATDARAVPYWVGEAVLAGTDDERFAHAMPVIDDARTVGYLWSEVSLDAIAGTVATPGLGGDLVGVAIVRTEAQGLQVVAGPALRAAAALDEVVPYSRTDLAAVRATASVGEVIGGLDGPRGSVLATAERIPGTPWSLVVTVDEDEAYGPYRHVLALGLAGLTLAGLASIAVTARVHRRLTTRIGRISASAAALEAGQLGVRVGDRTDDELGHLGRAFDRMADTLVGQLEQRRAMEAVADQLARRDMLTGLPNRLALEEHIDQQLGRRSLGDSTFAVLFCDLDEFKSVNDDLGHRFGDEVLLIVASRLRQVAGPHTFLARFGGDEFVLVRDTATGTDPTVFAQRIQASLSEPFVVDDQELFVTASIGIALASDDSTCDSLLREADAAMYRAKALGRHRHVTFDASIPMKALNRVDRTTELRRALVNGRLRLVYQPVVDLADRTPWAYEALVRWREGDTEIRPADLVERATELDLVRVLDRWVLHSCCTQLRRWRDVTRHVPVIDVNVTTLTLSDPGFAEEALGILAEHGVAPGELCFEVTEDAIAGPTDQVRANLERLRAAGARVAIDDFGIGHSSLARLRDLPVDLLKLDRCFVQDIDVDASAQAVTGSIVGLANQLGLGIVAEGIETERQLEVLRQLGCRYGQGFYVGVPGEASTVVPEVRAANIA